jgi:hypothetical protein
MGAAWEKAKKGAVFLGKIGLIAGAVLGAGVGLIGYGLPGLAIGLVIGALKMGLDGALVGGVIGGVYGALQNNPPPADTPAPMRAAAAASQPSHGAEYLVPDRSFQQNLDEQRRKQQQDSALIASQSGSRSMS